MKLYYNILNLRGVFWDTLYFCQTQTQWKNYCKQATLTMKQKLGNQKKISTKSKIGDLHPLSTFKNQNVTFLTFYVDFVSIL